MELGRGDGSICTFFGVHSGLAMTSIALLGDEEQKQRWLPAMARMEQIGAFGLTEPEHGSDAVALETRARRDGDHWVLDGAKRWIGNASFADLVIVWARDEDGKVGGFVVEHGTPGYAASVMTGKTAKRAVWQAEITLDGVRVPAANRLGEEGQGFPLALRALDHSRVTIGAQAVGIARAAFEFARDYARERVQFGKPIAAQQAIAFKLADMATEIDAARLLVWRAAWMARNGMGFSHAEGSMSKLKAGEVATRVTDEAIQVLGGYGFIRDFPVEKWHRDAKIYSLFEGTSEIQRLVISRANGGMA
jgi:glutaryl-CoA dehydrogenase